MADQQLLIKLAPITPWRSDSLRVINKIVVDSGIGRRVVAKSLEEEPRIS